jgi:hypothetical protein
MNRTKGKNEPDPDQHSERDTARRRDEWLRRSLNTPPKQHSEIVKERKAKRARGKGTSANERG